MPLNSPLSEAEKRRRRARGEVVEDGEYLHFNIAMRDSAGGRSVFLTDAPAGSIDAAVKAAIEQAAKQEGVKPSVWLAGKDQRALENFIAGIASKFVGGFTGGAIASAFSLDAAIKSDVDRQHAAHDAKFAFMGDRAPAFDRERAEFLARQGLGAEGAKALRDAAFAAQNSGAGAAELSRLSDVAERDYNAQRERLSDQRRNAWKGGADVRDAARRAQYGK